MKLCGHSEYKLKIANGGVMNGITYIELSSQNFEKTRKFYSELFGWKFDLEPEMKYMSFQAPAGPNGGFTSYYKPGQAPGIIFYIDVEDIDMTIKKAPAAGGSCITKKTQISPEIGYYAVLGDPDGNHIGIWSKN